MNLLSKKMYCWQTFCSVENFSTTLLFLTPTRIRAHTHTHTHTHAKSNKGLYKGAPGCSSSGGKSFTSVQRPHGNPTHHHPVLRRVHTLDKQTCSTASTSPSTSPPPLPLSLSDFLSIVLEGELKQWWNRPTLFSRFVFPICKKEEFDLNYLAAFWRNSNDILKIFKLCVSLKDWDCFSPSGSVCYRLNHLLCQRKDFLPRSCAFIITDFIIWECFIWSDIPLLINWKFWIVRHITFPATNMVTEGQPLVRKIDSEDNAQSLQKILIFALEVF